MSPSKPRLSELPGFIPCKQGEHLTDEQYRKVFAGSDRFFAVLNELALAAEDRLAHQPDAQREEVAL